MKLLFLLFFLVFSGCQLFEPGSASHSAAAWLAPPTINVTIPAPTPENPSATATVPGGGGGAWLGSFLPPPWNAVASTVLGGGAILALGAAERRRRTVTNILSQGIEAAAPEVKALVKKKARDLGLSPALEALAAKFKSK